jgi:abortive infection bacteriophage resistance protein
MTEPKALSSEDLLQLFKDRGMLVSDKDLEKIKHINYYKLKEFAHPLSKITKEEGKINISYDGVAFHEVLRRYYQDKNLRLFLLHAIEKIEVSIKTNFSHIMGLRYGAFGYLNFGAWGHRQKYTRFKIEEKQYRLKKNILKSLGKQRSSEFSNTNNLDPDGFPTIWLAIDTLTFGDIVIMLDMMNDNVLRKIASKYNASSDEFLSWIKCLHFIRNTCAHNSNLIDIKLTTKPKYRKEWVSCLYLLKSRDGAHTTPTNRLAAVICIVMYLVKAINPKYQLDNIQKSINSLCNRSEDRAKLLGFNTLNDAIKISRFI